MKRRIAYGDVVAIAACSVSTKASSSQSDHYSGLSLAAVVVAAAAEQSGYERCQWEHWYGDYDSVVRAPSN
jgi:hypothetical protein